MTIPQEQQLGPFLSNRFGDSYLYEVNRNAFDSIAAETLYQQQFGESFLQPNQLNLFVGTDSGLLLDYLRTLRLPEGSRYVFVEIPEVLQRLTAAGKLDDLPERVMVLRYEELWSRAEEYRLEDYAYLDRVLFYEALCVIDGHLQIYREQAFALRAELQNKLWAVTASVGNAYFVERHLQNLCEERVDATILKNHFKGKTAVLLGGGPSFDDLLPWLRENREKVVILAVSRVCRQLHTAGIAPHFIFSADPHDVNFDVSKEMFQFWEQSIFVCAYHVSPKLWGQWGGRSIYLGEKFPWQFLGRLENLEVAGPTVTNVALLAAVHMGFAQVVFGGVDFCFSRSGFTHASGSNEAAAGPRLGDTIIVATNDGGEAETIPDYACGIATMNDQARYAVRQGCRVINPAAQAAKLESVDYVPLEQIQFEPLTRNPVTELGALMPADDSAFRASHYREVVKELHRAESRMLKIKSLAKEALKCNDGLFGRNGIKADFKYKLRMDKIEAQLTRDFSDLYPLVKQYGIRSFLRMTRPDPQQEWSDEEVERLGRVYYQSCLESAEELLREFKSACQRAELRLEEEQEQPDFARLTQFWRAENQPGRARLWQNQHPGKWAALTGKEQQLLLGLEQEFENLLAETETPHMRQMRNDFALDGVKGGALKYFRAGDKQGLLRLREGLAKHPDREKAKMLDFFAAGLLEELAGHEEEAVEQYQRLIGADLHFLTEDTLLRILAISLAQRNNELALMALECLSGAADFYKPQYASMLRLAGQTDKALEVYADYLEKVPNDLLVMLKLGNLYQELGSEEGARLMYGFALELEPENQTAKALLAALDKLA